MKFKRNSLKIWISNENTVITLIKKVYMYIIKKNLICAIEEQSLLI